jgi:hypothetical protein
MLADISRANRAKQRICNCVTQHVSVRMSFQSTRMGNLYAAKDQLASFHQTMHVIANAAPNTHGFARIRRVERLNGLTVEPTQGYNQAPMRPIAQVAPASRSDTTLSFVVRVSAFIRFGG